MLQKILDALGSLRNERLIKGDNTTMVYADFSDVISNTGAGAAFEVVMAALKEAVGQDKFDHAFSLGGVDGTGKKVGITVDGIIDNLPLARATEYAKQFLDDQKQGWLKQEDGNFVKFNDSGIALNPYRFYCPLLGGQYKGQIEFVYRDKNDENLSNPRIITESEKWDYLKERYGAQGNTDEALSLAPALYLEQGVKLSPAAREHAANQMGFSFQKGMNG